MRNTAHLRHSPAMISNFLSNAREIRPWALNMMIEQFVQFEAFLVWCSAALWCALGIHVCHDGARHYAEVSFLLSIVKLTVYSNVLT